jgi:hypothetical protein
VLGYPLTGPAIGHAIEKVLSHGLLFTGYHAFARRSSPLSDHQVMCRAVHVNEHRLEKQKSKILFPKYVHADSSIGYSKVGDFS